MFNNNSQMTGDEKHIELQGIIDDLNNHLNSAPQRIRSYYLPNHNPPEDYPELDESPAQMLVDDAADLVQYEFQIQSQREAIILDGDWAYERSHYMHIAVAFELLLNAFYMKNNPAEYASKMESNRTPNLKDGKSQLFARVGPELSDAQSKRISLVIDLVRIKRNNAVHDGFHTQGHYSVSAPIYEVLGFLFNYVSDRDLEIVSELNNIAAQERETHVGLETERVEFPED